MKIGVVGKPSVGKSTFFKAATLMEVDIANYPFTTISPNSGFAHIRIPCVDKEFDTQCNPRTGYCKENQRYVPFELIDVAGLVPGAHEGRGRGLSFLSDLNEANALIHVIDISGSINEQGEDTKPGSYDPQQDIEFLEKELDYWYLGIIKKGWERFSRKIQQEHLESTRALAEQLSGLRVDEPMIKRAYKELGLTNNLMEWKEEQLMQLATYLRKKSKPMIIAANKIDKQHGKENLERLQKNNPELTIIPCSSEIELALREADKHELITYLPGNKTFKITNPEKLTEQQKKALEYMKEYLEQHETTGVQEILNNAALQLLKYIAVYPGGVKKLEDSEGRRLPDCFLVSPTTTPYDFAGILHTDFQKNYVNAVNVKTKKPIAKDQPLKHRDVIELHTNK